MLIVSAYSTTLATSISYVFINLVVEVEDKEYVLLGKNNLLSINNFSALIIYEVILLIVYISLEYTS